MRLDLSVLNTLKEQYVGTKGGVGPPKIFEKKNSIYIYIERERERERERKKSYFNKEMIIYNIFITNFKW